MGWKVQVAPILVARCSPPALSSGRPLHTLEVPAWHVGSGHVARWALLWEAAVMQLWGASRMHPPLRKHPSPLHGALHPGRDLNHNVLPCKRMVMPGQERC